MNTILKCHEIQLDQLKYIKEKEEKCVRIYNIKEKGSSQIMEDVYLLTPKMRYSLPVKYDKLRVSLLFKQLEKDRKTREKQFYQLIERIDKYIPRLVYANRKNWFHPDFHELEFEEFVENYHQSLKINSTPNPTENDLNKNDSHNIVDNTGDKNNDKANNNDKDKNNDSAYNNSEETFVNFNLPTNKYGEISIPVFTQNNKQLGISDLARLDPIQELAFSKYQAILLLKCRGIWIVEETFGLAWDIMQIKIFPDI